VAPWGTDTRAAHAGSLERKQRGGALGTLIGIGFWATLITLVVSAAVAPGFAVLALLPLAGVPYFLFCWIALTSDRNVE
jgi:hypothetical protein